MPQGVIQAAFTMGEIAPSLYGRIDFEGYYKGLRTCRNFIVSKYGGVDNRPGTQYIGNVDDSTQPHRMIPFQFNNQQQYVLILGNQTMQIVANGVLLNIGAPYNVTGYSLGSLYFSGNTAAIDLTLTVPLHPFLTGDSVSLNGVSTGANGIRTATTVDANTIKITFLGLPSIIPLVGSIWSGGGTIQESNSGTLTIPTPWPSSVLFQLKFTQSADVLTICHPNYSTMQIERLAETLWQVIVFNNVNGPFQDTNPNQALTVWVSSAAGTNAVIGGPITLESNGPLFTADMQGLEFYLQASTISVTPAWEVSIGVTDGDVYIYGQNYYKALNSNTTGTIPPTVTSGTCWDGPITGSTGVQWQYLHSGFGVVKINNSTDQTPGYVSFTQVKGTVVSYVPDSLVYSDSSTPATYAITSVSGSNWITTTPVCVVISQVITILSGATVIIANFPGLNGTYIVDSSYNDGVNTYVYLAGVYKLNITYASGSTATVRAQSVLTAASPSYIWALPAWGMTAQGFPGTTAYFQDRQLFGGSNGQPSNVWFSTTAGFNDFSVENPVLDSDAITDKILSNQVNTIKHMIELTYLLIFTSGGVYMTQGGQNNNGTITPSTISLSFQVANAIGDIPPLRINNFALFVQELGSQVRTIGYSFAENAFVGQDVTTMSNHLFKFNKIVDWCYQEIPYSCIWCVRDDGILIGLTFNPEQQITGWHRHDTQGSFESVCCVTENNQNVVYAIVKRTLQGVTVRCIERMAQRAFQDPSDAYFVDCGLTYDGRLANTTASTFSGLDYLDGQTVSILADGIVYPQQVVVGGYVTIPNPAQVVHVGLPYTSDFETLDMSSMRADIRDKKKTINAVSLIVDQSSGFMVGPDTDSLVEVTQRRTENYGASTDLISGILDENIPCGWDKKGRIFVRQDKPLPVSILAIIPQAEVGGF
jgi:hypothetical protein